MLRCCAEAAKLLPGQWKRDCPRVVWPPGGVWQSRMNRTDKSWASNYLGLQACTVFTANMCGIFKCIFMDFWAEYQCFPHIYTFVIYWWNVCTIFSEYSMHRLFCRDLDGTSKLFTCFQRKAVVNLEHAESARHLLEYQCSWQFFGFFSAYSLDRCCTRFAWYFLVVLCISDTICREICPQGHLACGRILTVSSRNVYEIYM